MVGMLTILLQRRSIKISDTFANISKGAFAEKVRDSASALGVLLLKVAEADGTLQDYATVAAMLAGANTEANFTSYARKTGITGTVTVDNTNNRVDCDMPDQTWSPAGGGTNNTLVKLVLFYDEGGTDATRIPIGYFDFSVSTDGSDLTAVVNAAGFARAA